MPENLFAGADVCIEKVKQKEVSLIIICKDASPSTKEKFERLSKEYEIPIIFFSKIETLSRAVGKENKAVYVVIDKGFADNILKLINESKGAIN